MLNPQLAQTAGGKPPKYKELANTQFGLAGPENVICNYLKHSEEMRDEFVGPMPVQQFIATFMRTETTKKLPDGYVEVFKDKVACGNEFAAIFVSASPKVSSNLFKTISYIMV